MKVKSAPMINGAPKVEKCYMTITHDLLGQIHTVCALAYGEMMSTKSSANPFKLLQ